MSSVLEMRFPELNGGPLHNQSISAVAHLIERREVSPVELVMAAFQRIDRLNPALHAFITATPEQALRAARQAEAEIVTGRYRGPLHGIPIAHKDVFETRGVRTTGHSRVLHDFIPTRDATAVRRLAAAGAISLGKTNTYEFGNGGTDFYGTPVNPRDPEKVTGGSSAGSASATAVGLCFGATGTDGGGSLRVPAALCGVVGLKPSRGRVSCAGVLPYARSLTVAGPMARSAPDCALLLHAMSADHARVAPASAQPFEVPDFADESESRPLKGLRIGVLAHGPLPAVDAEVRALARAAWLALTNLGAELVELVLPFDPAVADAVHIAIERREAIAVHRRWLQTNPSGYGSVTRQRLLLGACVSEGELELAQLQRRRITRALNTLLADVDLIASPTVPCAAWPLGSTRPDSTAFTKPANLAGLPAISVVGGFTTEGLPVGIQCIGRMFDEALMVRVATAYERTHVWPARVPDDESLVKKRALVDPAPTSPAGTWDQELQDEVRHTLRSASLPCAEEDVAPIAGALASMRAALQRAGKK
ncbi:MAG: amidase [Chloroflexota bacterium]|nr:amidase [Chloroflexota bacterium]